MESHSQAPARILAALALAAAFVGLMLILSSGSGTGDGETEGSRGQERTAIDQPEAEQPNRRRRAYVVQSGDTLIGISEKTGVSVRRLQELNPEIDPQILTSGQRLRLR